MSSVFERPLRGLGRRRRRAVRHHHVRPVGQRGAGAAGGAGDGHRHGRPAGRRRANRRCGQCDHALLVPDTETARIQECHIALGHAVLELLEDRLVARPICDRPGDRVRRGSSAITSPRRCWRAASAWSASTI